MMAAGLAGTQPPEPSIKPANRNATENARKVLTYLYHLPHGTENRVVSGHLAGGAVGPGVPDSLAAGYRFKMDEIEYLHEVSGQWVGLIGADYCAGWYDYRNPLESQMYYQGVNPGLIDYWNKGGLVIITTHQFDPREFHRDGGQCVKRTAKTPLEFSRVYQEGTAENEGLRGIMDRWAEGLRELSEAGVVVLWRPYNESTNSGKWWCRQPADQFKKLYRYTFNYLTHTKGLNNLLWVYDGKLPGKNALELSHYPGDEYADVVGLTMNWDSGPCAQTRHPYPRKVFGCVEFNVRTKARWNTIQRDYDYMKKFNCLKRCLPYSSFFMSWDRAWGPYARGTVESLKRMYNDPWVVNRDEINWR